MDLSVIFNHMMEDVEMVEKPFHRPPFSERVKKRLRTLRAWTTWAPADQEENGTTQKRSRDPGPVDMEG